MNNKPFILWSFLDNNVFVSLAQSLKSAPVNKSFAQALKNSCSIVVVHLHQPYIKGDAIAIKIPEEDYKADMQRCKNHIHGRLIFSKGDTPIKFANLKAKLSTMWSIPQEYWSTGIIFSIAGGIGTPISLDDATNNRTFGHFAKVRVDINLKAQLPDQILVERERFAFFVNLEYENLLEFCNGCEAIGHMISNCRRENERETTEEVPKAKKHNHVHKEPSLEKLNDLVIDLEFDNRDLNLDNMERVILSPNIALLLLL
ncbi:PREDICTED: uncharacterized protein LOC109356164 [Lupinus angustifolius]|uniref:uncharacterized protein LOC109356164 n=1 Tax=Lupinus angustifolius TaxID=3871 RepID=UPI00092F32FD|nr:PREDICTED: uncharacterized protein LOC109356164 [Lupinus angustifolius]